MATNKLTAFDRMAAAFKAHLDRLPIQYYPLINTSHGVIGYIAPDGIYYVNFNTIWEASPSQEYTKMSIVGRMLNYKCGDSWRSLALRPVSFNSTGAMFMSAYGLEYYPHHYGGDDHQRRGFILDDSIQFTSSNSSLIIGYKAQRIYVDGKLFNYCKYYYDINFNQIKPIKTRKCGITFATVYDVPTLCVSAASEGKITKFSDRGYLKNEYYETGDEFWQVRAASGGRYVFVQLASNEWALHDGTEKIDLNT